MSSAVIYLDESGDLGWTFDAEYRRGGSSRYLTICAVIIPNDKKHLLAREIKKLYKKYGFSPKEEKKWARMTSEQRVYFATQAKHLKGLHPDIQYFSITVYKPNVYPHIRCDANILYNYSSGNVNEYGL